MQHECKTSFKNQKKLCMWMEMRVFGHFLNCNMSIVKVMKSTRGYSEKKKMIIDICAEEKSSLSFVSSDVTSFKNVFNTIKIILKKITYVLEPLCTSLHSFPFTMWFHRVSFWVQCINTGIFSSIPMCFPLSDKAAVLCSSFWHQSLALSHWERELLLM